MKKVNQVIKLTTKERLEEFTEKVNYSEQIYCDNNRSCSLLKLDNFHKNIIWDYNTVFIRVGDILRGFYEMTPDILIILRAYEILNEEDVIFIAISSEYRFVENKNVT